MVTGGKPYANIKWFRRGVELRTDNVSVTQLTTGADNELTSNGQSISVSQSSLTLRPHSTDNGMVYMCQAIHTALSTPLTHSIKLSVLYPPGMLFQYYQERFN